MDGETSKAVAVAMRAASQWLRKQNYGRSLEDVAEEEMRAVDFPTRHLDTVLDLTNAFLMFSDAVRVAERHDTPILQYVGENVPSRR